MASIERYAHSDLHGLSQRVSAIVQRGGVVAIPTETFYGLGVNPFDEQAVSRLLRIKGRSDGKPVLVLIGSLDQLPRLAQNVPPVARILIDAFWPGPLTILFPALPSLPRNLTAGTGTVGVRLSSCEPLVALLRQVGPLTGTSANRSNQPSPQTALMVEQDLGQAVDAIIDAGATPGEFPSTVIDVQSPIRIIREGAVSRQMIQNVLQTHGVSLAE
ncbi:MAG TPA: L-threonylcarbamoyladenylate synthase [Nitrospira sp.]|nr:L-threonylcarbamoyladenylate synthase [Nitrospira sp.]